MQIRTSFFSGLGHLFCNSYTRPHSMNTCFPLWPSKCAMAPGSNSLGLALNTVPELEEQLLLPTEAPLLTARVASLCGSSSDNKNPI